MPRKSADPATELEGLIAEYSFLKDRLDAMEEMLAARKKRILLLMNEGGMHKYDATGGSAAFTRRRSFRVHDVERLAELLTPLQLAAIAKVTADLYDACVQEEIDIDEAVTVGIGESLAVSRPRTKKAKAIRKAHIEESRRQAEDRIATIREQLREGA